MNVCASHVTEVKVAAALALEGFSFVSVSSLLSLVSGSDVVWYVRNVSCRRLIQWRGWGWVGQLRGVD